MEPTSKGYYIIGVHSYSDTSYTIEASTVHRVDDDAETSSQDQPLNVKHLYVGAQDWDTYLKAGETKYFYFQNWREEDLVFSFQYLNRHYLTHRNIEMTVGQVNFDNDEDDVENERRVPKYKSELPTSWLTATNDGKVEIHPGDSQYCVFCTFVVKLQNKFAESTSDSRGDVRLNIIVE